MKWAIRGMDEEVVLAVFLERSVGKERFEGRLRGARVGDPIEGMEGRRAGMEGVAFC